MKYGVTVKQDDAYYGFTRYFGSYREAKDYAERVDSANRYAKEKYIALIHVAEDEEHSFYDYL